MLVESEEKAAFAIEALAFVGLLESLRLVEDWKKFVLFFDCINHLQWQNVRN